LILTGGNDSKLSNVTSKIDFKIGNKNLTSIKIIDYLNVNSLKTGFGNRLSL
jgi:hypothetical protein